MSNEHRINEIPDRGIDEEPATAKQIAYLRNLCEMPESDLQGLGKWQASYVIDEILRVKKANNAAPSSTSNIGMAIIIAIVIIALLYWIF